VGNDRAGFRNSLNPRASEPLTAQLSQVQPSRPSPRLAWAGVATRPEHMEHHGTFGTDAFGRRAEHAARFFGTPQYIVGQTIVVVIWIVLNSIAVIQHWDPYPFILLNLAFSTQAAYAAPLILLAQTRQAERDKLALDKAEKRHDETERQAAERVAALRVETDKLTRLLDANTNLTRQDKELTEQVAKLTREIHGRLLRSE
jgi:uncharacterized membrane protein